MVKNGRRSAFCPDHAGTPGETLPEPGAGWDLSERRKTQRTIGAG